MRDTAKIRQISFRVTPQWAEVIAEAAARDMYSTSDYCRAAVVAKLRADGKAGDEPARQ